MLNRLFKAFEKTNRVFLFALKTFITVAILCGIMFAYIRSGIYIGNNYGILAAVAFAGSTLYITALLFSYWILGGIVDENEKDVRD